MPEARAINNEKLKSFVKQTGDMVAAGFNCAITVLGDRLDLYRHMADVGATSAEDLAARAGLHPRWVREWLQHQACIGQVDYADGRFTLSPEAEAVLVNEEHPAFLMGAFDSVLTVAPAVDRLEEAFRTGIGMSYDEHGPGCACAIERMGAFTKNHRLVPELIPHIDTMHEKLSNGARVIDVGCGGALSTLVMARTYPNSEFIGYDISEHALNRARANLEESRLDNVSVANPLVQAMPRDESVDFATTFDVIHDAPHPAQLIEDIYHSLKPGGVWLCEDIQGFETFEENLASHPMAAMLYGFSVMVCMNSSMSTPDGAGLGTLGFTESLAQEMTSAAGFGGFQKLDVENPLNNYYVLTK